MYPIYNAKRRKCRTREILESHGTNENSLFVNTARYPGKEYLMTVVIDTKGEIMSACSIEARHSEDAEEVAVALAILSRGHKRVISDSKPALGSYVKRTNLYRCGQDPQ